MPNYNAVYCAQVNAYLTGVGYSRVCEWPLAMRQAIWLNTPVS
jgi:hypothetical protein